MPSTGFDEFFRRDHPLLVGFLRKNGFELEQAKDAATEAMIAAYKNWSKIDSPKSWVRKVAYRTAHKQRQRTRDELHHAIIAGWETPIHWDPDVVQAKEERGLLLQLLNELPHKQRQVMAWHLDGFNNNEIAKELNMLQATVGSNLRHARDKLKRAYRARSTDTQPPNSEKGEGAIR